MIINIIIIIIIISSSRSSSSSSRSSSSSSSSTQQSSRGPVDEMHVFQKKMFSLGQKQLFKSTSMQKHTFLIWSATKTKNGWRLGEMHLFEFTFILYKITKQKKGSLLGEMHILS